MKIKVIYSHIERRDRCYVVLFNLYTLQEFLLSKSLTIDVEAKVQCAQRNGFVCKCLHG